MEQTPHSAGSTNSPEAMDCVSVILAAGKSTRMKSRIPKPLHEICGRGLTSHVISACKDAGIVRNIVVVGFESERVMEGIGDQAEFAYQANQRGSGDAVKAAQALLSEFSGDVVVLAGDVPLIKSDTLLTLTRAHRVSGAVATLLTAKLKDAGTYGRIVRNDSGMVTGIVEAKDCTEEQLAIQEWNPSIYCFRAPELFKYLSQVEPNNIQGEFYLTDVIGLMARAGHKIETITTDDSEEVMGVNNLAELAVAGAILRKRVLDKLMLSGVTIIDPSSTYVDVDVSIGADTMINPNTHIRAGSVIGEECMIGPNTSITNCTVANRTTVLSSHLTQSNIGSDVKIGPFAHIRPGTVIADKVKVGDFVETKNAIIGERVSISHLSYVGDASVGAGTNIGAGVVTCNYDGVHKYRTDIGAGTFVGTNSTLVAPVSVGDGSFVAAGSVVTKDVPPDALAVARSRQENKLDWARKRREKIAKTK